MRFRHASEQDRPDIVKRQQAWFDSQLDLDPEKLVFIDETWATNNMARKNGRASKGERLRASVPHGRWKTTTFVGALRLSGMNRADGARRADQLPMVSGLC